MQLELLRTIDVFLEGASKPLIVILGQTASGKTAFSIEIAQHVQGEIINADSRQLYRYLNIGTAKIKENEKNGIPHHLIDVRDPNEEVTVGWYQEHATHCIDDILKRDHIPILVGGSMLYISSITDALSMAPVADPKRHEKLMELYDRDGGGALYRRLQKMDADAAAALHPNNKPRLVRAVEICELLGAGSSRVISERGELRPRSAVTDRCAYDLLIFGMECSGDQIKKRIAERTDVMFDSGWIEEVCELLAHGHKAQDPALKSTGYREIIRYLSELESLGSDADIDAMQTKLKEHIITKTYQYAKRQMKWWRGDERIRWVSSFSPS